MKRSILSISSNRSLNYLLKTNLAQNYDFVQATDAFHGAYELKRNDYIELIIIDMDEYTQQNIDFVHHINTSGFYQMPIIVLSTDSSIQCEISVTEGQHMEFLSKPFSPVILSQKVKDCMAQSLLLN